VHNKTAVAAESFTADPVKGRWQLDPYALKPTGDRAFTAGVNLTVLHTYAMQPWTTVMPGFTMGWWGTHFGRTQTWWNQSKPFFEYLSRCQYMLQQGLPAVDVLSLGSSGAPAGYKADACDEDVLLHGIKVRDGKLVLANGTSYAVLVLSADSTHVSSELATRVGELVRDGAIVVGPKPTSTGSLTDYPHADEAVKKLADDVWGDCDGTNVKTHDYGKGRVFWGIELADVLAKQSVNPDVSFANGTWPLLWIHRTTDDGEIYFLANQRRAPVATEVSFRINGAAPEIWDPQTGKTSPASVWSIKDGRTDVFLRLDPAGSTFVVFPKKPASGDHVVAVQLDGQPVMNPDRPGEGAVIRQATYGILDDPNRRVDVTAALQARLASGEALSGNNELAGDPAPNVVKQIHIVYEMRGQRMEKIFREGETIEFTTETRMVTLPPAELIASTDGAVSLIAFKPGTFDFAFASGRSQQVKIEGVPPDVAINGPWHVAFPPNLGAPTSIELSQLASWTTNSDPGVKYFSGTATYTTKFDVPPNVANANGVVLLDLGDVRNIAEVKLNGQNLGILWKPPFRVDVSGKLRAGENELSVSVTNLWPNRMIGDEQEPDDVQWASARMWNADGKRVSGGQPMQHPPDWVADPTTRPSKGRVTLSTWKFYTKDSPLLDSGLLGPVKIVSAVKKQVASP
jgi:(4-O-methyl)-D-glucuronate---lignin esterase